MLVVGLLSCKFIQKINPFVPNTMVAAFESGGLLFLPSLTRPPLAQSEKVSPNTNQPLLRSSFSSNNNTISLPHHLLRCLTRQLF